MNIKINQQVTMIGGRKFVLLGEKAVSVSLCLYELHCCSACIYPIIRWPSFTVENFEGK
jgi:hypothetical protein